MKEAQCKRAQLYGSNYMMCERGKPIYSDRNQIRAVSGKRGWLQRGVYKGIVWSDENVLYLDCGDAFIGYMHSLNYTLN